MSPNHLQIQDLNDGQSLAVINYPQTGETVTSLENEIMPDGRVVVDAIVMNPFKQTNS